MQIGINAGPRHATVFGYAKSYTKKLDADTMIEHDSDIIGITSILWAIIQTAAPSEVVASVKKALHKISIPSIAIVTFNQVCYILSLSNCLTQTNVGDGFKLTIDDKLYKFPTVQRGPPEIYLSQGYVA